MVSSRGARLVGTAAAVALALVVSGCGGSGDGGSAASSGGAAQKPYDVLALAPLSGTLATYGAALKASWQASAEVVNAHGGIDGRKVKLTVQDDRGDPAEVASLVNAAVAGQSRPDFIVPEAAGPETVAGVPIAAAAGILSGNNGGANPLAAPKNFPLYMTALPSNGNAAEALVQKLADRKIRSMGLIVDDNESGVANIDTYKAAAARAGIRVTGVERLASDAVDATPQMQRLQAGSPDVLVMSMFGAAVKPVMAARDKLGWGVPVWGDHRTAATSLSQLLTPEQMKATTLVAPAYLVQGDPATKTPAFTTAYDALRKAAGGQLAVPLATYIHNYMVLIVTMYAADHAHSTDPHEVWKARTSLKSANMPLYVGSSKLYTDPENNFPTYAAADFAVLPAGPIQDGMLVPGD